MKVRIGNLEVTDVTPDELDELVKRYGGDTAKTPPKSMAKEYFDKLQEAGAGAADTVLLKKFIETPDGLTTIEVGEMLGRRGKSARPAVRDWAKRVGLTQDENVEVFEDARVGTQRGIRLKSSFLDVARHIAGQKG